MTAGSGFSRGLIAVAALFILASVNTSILRKERIKRSGEVLYLPLAPVDPRSLMQGDYMALRFELAREIDEARRPASASRESGVFDELDQQSEDSESDPLLREEAFQDGKQALAPITIDEHRVGHLAKSPGAAALKLRYRIRNRGVWLGTNAFFFEEGEAERFRDARFGEFRVDRRSGEAVLIGLANAKLERL